MRRRVLFSLLVVTTIISQVNSQSSNCTLIDEANGPLEEAKFDVFPPELTVFEIVVACSDDFTLNELDANKPTLALLQARLEMPLNFRGVFNASEGDGVELLFNGTIRGYSNFANEYPVRLKVVDTANGEYFFNLLVNVSETAAVSDFDSTGRVRPNVGAAIASAQTVSVGSVQQVNFQVKNEDFNDTVAFTSFWSYTDGSTTNPDAIDEQSLPGTLQPLEDDDFSHMLFRWQPSPNEVGDGYVLGFRPADEANFYNERFVGVMAIGVDVITHPPPSDDFTAIYIVVSSIIAFIIVYILGGCCYQYYVNGEARMPHAYFWSKLCPGCCMYSSSREYLSSLDLDNMNEETTRERFVSTDSFLEYGTVSQDEKEQPKLIL